MALLSACAGGGANHGGYAETTAYYLDHAEGNYNPPGPPSDPWGPYINMAASRFDIPAPWIRQVMRVESGGHEYSNGQLIVSAAGAMGLMQLEPETYREMANRYGLGPDPFNPYDNIMAGTAYIHQMYEVYGSPGFLAAYNAGPGRLDEYMSGNASLPYETQNYVAMIAPNIEGYYPQHRSDADQLALNTMPAGVNGGILPPGFNPQAVREDDASAVAAPVEVASVAPPAPMVVADNDTPDNTQPAVNYNYASVAAPAAAAPSVIAESLPTQSAPERTAAPPPSEIAAAPVEYVPAPPPPPPHFSMVPEAMADIPPPPPPPEHHYMYGSHIGWAIQVGAYDTSSNARAALGIAELSAVQILDNGRPVVESVHFNGRTKYRARVMGLGREDAVNACNRLSGGPTGCVVLPPEAQS